MVDSFNKSAKKVKPIKMSIKDKATSPLKKITTKLDRLGKKKANPKISVDDRASGKLDSLMGKMKKIALMAVGAKVAMETGKAIWNAGTTLEKQQVSMQHFLGGDSKAASTYMSALRENANATPFETGEVVAAGTRAIQISEGDTKSAMEMVKLAEDMAALTPGKTIEMAMEAIADAKMGEMERLKEFGFKGSKELFDEAGGNILAMKGVNGKSLTEMYSGGAEKLSTTGAGLLSTSIGSIKSGFADASLKIIDKLKPALKDLIPIAKNIAKALPEIAEKAIAGVTYVWDLVKPLVDGAVALISPAIDLIATSFGPALSVVASVVENFVRPAFEWVGSAAESVANDFGGTLAVATEVISGAFQVLAGIVEAAAGAVQTFTGWLSAGANSPYTKNLNKVTASGHATGTQYFGGGITKINELGEEMIDLPRGSRIYPAGTTQNIIQREMTKNTSSKAGPVNVTINVNTSGDIDEEVLGDIIFKRFSLAYQNV